MTVIEKRGRPPADVAEFRIGLTGTQEKKPADPRRMAHFADKEVAKKIAE